jgi:hypothetical protein
MICIKKQIKFNAQIIKVDVLEKLKLFQFCSNESKKKYELQFLINLMIH